MLNTMYKGIDIDMDMDMFFHKKASIEMYVCRIHILIHCLT